MPSVISHIAIPLVLKYSFRGSRISKRLFILSIVCCILPDLDVIAFHFDIPYSSQWGHRGFTHSLGFALIAGLIASICSQYIRSGRTTIFLVIFTSTASHALLDSATNGGLGCALFWPLSPERYFLPWRPIQVSPIGIDAFISEYGFEAIKSELLWIWLPSALIAFTAIIATRLIYRVRRP